MRGALYLVLLLLVWEAPILVGHQDYVSNLFLALKRDSPDRARYLRQLKKAAVWVVGLGGVVYAMYYTAHHLGQVFLLHRTPFIGCGSRV